MNIIRGELPKGLRTGAIEEAVNTFTNELDCKGDRIGFFNQTIGNIHAAIYRNNGDFWLAFDESSGDVLGYVLGHVSTDVDGKLTYWLTQAWASPTVRGKKVVRLWLGKLKAKAQEYLCGHIMVVSGRDGQDAAYCRFLGDGFRPYATLLIQDI